jgi:hypothetical protein
MPAAHFTWSFQDSWRINNYSCVVANSSSAYQRYTGAMPWSSQHALNGSADMRNASYYFANSTTSMNM